ncbi:hypothetical protein D9758_011330 [Tetrapyrgos nigripes]|uniref:Uncharacterized protein n=1 Tax=Tetrapyrgos nigripes TaxID=182062 RepID=A0A8H5G8G1_9AGAR|nr:hypothetical protein D9758_011330 [Tetrapyrgos nigripes]
MFVKLVPMIFWSEKRHDEEKCCNDTRRLEKEEIALTEEEDQELLRRGSERHPDTALACSVHAAKARKLACATEMCPCPTEPIITTPLQTSNLVSFNLPGMKCHTAWNITSANASSTTGPFHLLESVSGLALTAWPINPAGHDTTHGPLTLERVGANDTRQLFYLTPSL